MTVDRSGQGDGLDGAQPFAISLLGRADLEAMHALAAHAVSRPWTRQQLQSELERQHGHALGARREPSAELCGYILFWAVAGEMEVVDLLVSPKQRRRGVGDALLHQGLAQARAEGAQRVFLDVRASNEAARQLYEKAGFTQTGLRRAYYPPDGEDALILQRDLQSGL